MGLRSLATFLVGAVGGLTACALSLQASGAWTPTETQGATVVAVAALVASVATIRAAVDRYQSDIRWRRWRGLAVSVVISLASVGATATLALVAGQALRLGPAGLGVVIGVAAAAALADAVFGAYSDGRALSDEKHQKLLESESARLLAGAFEQIDIAPGDIEVVLFLKARNFFHPKRAALRVVHTVCMGASHDHPNVIHEGRSTTEADARTPIWKCYRDGEPVEPSLGTAPQTSKTLGGIRLGFRSDSALAIWAAPVRNKRSDVVGVLAVQAYATYSAREPHRIVVLPVGFTAIVVGGVVFSDY
jgi:hypothetical protein